MEISYNWLRELTDVSMPPQELAERLTMAGLAVDSVREAGGDFDLATLAENRIVVRRARAGERIKTLDGVERELDTEMLVIADAARAVAVAGVMGGEETEISEATTDVLIESAYFDPQSVRRTSKALGPQTEASYRFERGVDYEGVRRAQDRCVALICEIAGGTATADAIDVYPSRITPPVVPFRPRRVEELTGLTVNDE